MKVVLLTCLTIKEIKTRLAREINKGEELMLPKFLAQGSTNKEKRHSG